MTAGSIGNETNCCARFARLPLKLTLLALASVLIAGCLQVERIVQVNADGSGVLIERMVLGNEIIDMMAGMQPEGETFNIRDNRKLSGNAAKYGDSVRFLSATDLVTDFGRGYEARYAFDDINLLRIPQNVEDSIPGDSAARDDSPDGKTNYTTFTLRRTNPVGLVIHWPVNESGPGVAAEDSTAENSDATSTPEQEQMAMEMMKMALEDMRMAMHVEVMGEIVDTNATHINGTRVTLIDIDFGAFLSNEAALEAMAAKKLDSVADMKEMMKLIPGLKLEIEPLVAILFR